MQTLMQTRMYRSLHTNVEESAYCSSLRRAATNTLHAAHCNTLQHTPCLACHTHTFSLGRKGERTWQDMPVYMDRIDEKVVEVHCNTLQPTATHCNTPQRIVTHCNRQYVLPLSLARTEGASVHQVHRREDRLY